ncbi:hypothetical protein ACLG6S_17200 [Thermodesulfobacteriota bacterium B35]
MCDSCGCHIREDDGGSGQDRRKIVDLHKSLLAANREQAMENRHHIEAMGAVALNLISSPGQARPPCWSRPSGVWRTGCVSVSSRGISRPNGMRTGSGKRASPWSS